MWLHYNFGSQLVAQKVAQIEISYLVVLQCPVVCILLRSSVTSFCVATLLLTSNGMKLLHQCNDTNNSISLTSPHFFSFFQKIWRT